MHEGWLYNLRRLTAEPSPTSLDASMQSLNLLVVLLACSLFRRKHRLGLQIS